MFLAMAAATFMTRAAPFVLLTRVRSHPFLRGVSAILPAMIMVVLVFFSLVTLEYTGSLARILLTVLAAVWTAFIHWMFGHALVSILSATGLYVFGIQILGF